MRHVFVLALLTVPLAGLPARAQYGPPPSGERGNGVALVTNWIRQYLHRPPNVWDVGNGEAINAGTADPLSIQAGILGSDDYFVNIAQGDERSFIDHVFTDVVGRPPSPGEARYWYNRLMDSPEGVPGRNAIAHALLQRYPPDLSAEVPAPADALPDVSPGAPPPVPEPTYEYRRPYYRVWHDRDRDRDYRRPYDRDRDRDRDYRRPYDRDRNRDHDRD